MDAIDWARVQRNVRQSELVQHQQILATESRQESTEMSSGAIVDSGLTNSSVKCVQCMRNGKDFCLLEIDGRILRNCLSKHEPTGDEPYEENTATIMSMPGIQRHVEFPFDDL